MEVDKTYMLSSGTMNLQVNLFSELEMETRHFEPPGKLVEQDGNGDTVKHGTLYLQVNLFLRKMVQCYN